MRRFSLTQILSKLSALVSILGRDYLPSTVLLSNSVPTFRTCRLLSSSRSSIAAWIGGLESRCSSLTGSPDAFALILSHLLVTVQQNCPIVSNKQICTSSRSPTKFRNYQSGNMQVSIFDYTNRFPIVPSVISVNAHPMVRIVLHAQDAFFSQYLLLTGRRSSV